MGGFDCKRRVIPLFLPRLPYCVRTRIAPDFPAGPLTSAILNILV